MGFLSDAIASSGESMLEPFAEVVVLATLCWRGLAHKQPFSSTTGSVNRFAALAQQRLTLLSVPAASAHLYQPMRLFANLFANATIIWLQTPVDATEEHALVSPLQSAGEIASLTKPLKQCGFFTVRCQQDMKCSIRINFTFAQGPSFRSHAYSSFCQLLAPVHEECTHVHCFCATES